MPLSFEPARDALLAVLAEYATADSAVLALWLQGSLATGEADAFSDIDAY
jgi:predicted nucleotidyltransferase